MEDDILKQKVDGGHEFWSIYLTCSLVLQVLQAAHDDLGHNGFPRTYTAVKWVFYWKKHQRECPTTLQTLPSVHAAQIGECEV